MSISNQKKANRRILLILVPLLVVIVILAYFQLYYTSGRVNKGMAKLETQFKGHRHQVTAVRFLPGDSFLVTGSVDQTIKVWDRITGRVIREMKQPQGISYLDLSSDGKYVATGSYDSIIRLWRLSDGALLREFRGHQGTVWTVAFSPDGKKIASSGDDAVIHIWDVETGSLLRQLKGHKRIVWSVRFSPDGAKLASGSFDYSFKLWNVEDGRLLWDNRAHKETVVDLAFSHDGSMLATTSDDKSIKIWDLAGKKLLRTMQVAEHVQAVAFSPNDRRLMTGGRDKPMIGEFLQNIFGDSEYNKGVSARLWDVQTGELLQTFSRHANDVMDVDYSHDGKHVATASADKTAEVWRVEK